MLVVVERGLTPVEKTTLATSWSAEALPCPAIGLELALVREALALQCGEQGDTLDPSAVRTFAKPL